MRLAGADVVPLDYEPTRAVIEGFAADVERLWTQRPLASTPSTPWRDAQAAQRDAVRARRFNARRDAALDGTTAPDWS